MSEELPGKSWKLAGQSGKLPGNLWIAVKFHSGRTSGEVAGEPPGNFGNFQGSPGAFQKLGEPDSLPATRLQPAGISKSFICVNFRGVGEAQDGHSVVLFATTPLVNGLFILQTTAELQIRCLPTGVKIAKIGKRGFRGQKKPHFPVPRKKGHFESKNSHFHCGAL